MKETKTQLKDRVKELENEIAFLKGKIAVLELLKEPQQINYPIITPIPQINPPSPNLVPWVIPQGPTCPHTQPHYPTPSTPYNPWWPNTFICSNSGETNI